ncbi:MAG TPA: hypothetical protein PKC28_13360 [Bdellovibrionales bacterium]|nr:hypothetical protein [Bdellovibrionales bacterium]
MSFWKYLLITSFGLFAVICVSYANSQEVAPPGTQVWASPEWKIWQICKLKVEEGVENTQLFTVLGETGGAFQGFWPEGPGEVLMESRENLSTHIPGEPNEPARVLIVSFIEVDNQIVPTSFSFRDRKNQVHKDCRDLSLQK